MTAKDRKSHIVRLRHKSQYTCNNCLQLGKGLAWKCENQACGEYLHPQCLLLKSTGKVSPLLSSSLDSESLVAHSR